MTSTITSIEQFEHSKENIMPVKGGRSGSALSRAFGIKVGVKPDVESNSLEKQRQQLQKNIEASAEGDDPLACWIEYFEWAKDSFPHTRQQQLQVIQACTKLFRNDPRYQQDLRYLKMWILYADMLTNPVEMFNYLFNKDIGTNFGVFYEARALSYENFGKFKECEETFKVGIHRNLVDAEHLKKSHQRFRSRMLERVSALQQKKAERSLNPEPTTEREPERRSTSRTALSQISSRSSSIALPKSGNSSKIPPQQSISVLVDSSVPEVQPDFIKVQWNEFATEEASGKENKSLAVGWTGQTLPQKKRSKPKQTFAIYIDEEAAVDPVEPVPEIADDDEEYFKMIQMLKGKK